MRWLSVTFVTLLGACASEPSVRLSGVHARTVELAAIERSSARSPIEARADEDTLARALFRFDAGAPPSGSATIGPDGAVYVATTEGYLHALGPDGEFRWSYTLSAAAAGAPRMLPSGDVVAATVDGVLFALQPNGRARWIYRAKVAIVTELAVDERGAIYFGGRDQHVHEVSSRGGGRWRAPAYNAITSGPALAGGRVVVASSTPKLVSMVGVLERSSLVLDAAVEAPLVADAKGRVYAIVRDVLMAFDANRTLAWSLAGVRHAPALAGESLAVVTLDGRVLWLTRGGEIEREARAPGVASAAPVLGDDGALFVPLEDGTVAAQGRGSARRVEVGNAAVRTPAIDRTRVVAVADDGAVVGFTR